MVNTRTVQTFAADSFDSLVALVADNTIVYHRRMDNDSGSVQRRRGRKAGGVKEAVEAHLMTVDAKHAERVVRFPVAGRTLRRINGWDAITIAHCVAYLDDVATLASSVRPPTYGGTGRAVHGMVRMTATRLQRIPFY